MGFNISNSLKILYFCVGYIAASLKSQIKTLATLKVTIESSSLRLIVKGVNLD